MTKERLHSFDYKMFDRARKAALPSDFGACKVGCVLVYKHHVIAEASNTEKTSPKQKKYNKYRHFHNNGAKVQHKSHSEIRAISKVPYPVAQQIDWSKVSLYTYRIAPGLPLGQGLSRPCAGCMAAIKDIGIRDIYYSTDDGFAYERII